MTRGRMSDGVSPDGDHGAVIQRVLFLVGVTRCAMKVENATFLARIVGNVMVL